MQRAHCQQLRLLVCGLLLGVAAASTAGRAGKECYFRQPMLHPNVTGLARLLKRQDCYSYRLLSYSAI